MTVERSEEDDADRTIRRLRRLAELMDSAYGIPGTRLRFGLDSLIGLLPGIGDVATAVPSAVIVYSAVRLGARKRTVARMVVNAGVDLLVGAVPLVGDLFDLAFRANKRNVALLEKELARTR